MIIIADIAGQLDALERLVAQFPADEEIVLVGDLVDRGPYSAEVVDWAINNPRVTTIMGNHEHMMIDFWEDTGIYDDGVWEMNGGMATQLSYKRCFGDSSPPGPHLEWLKNLPKYKLVHDKSGSVLITHAPIHARLDLQRAEAFIESRFNLEMSLLWNRSEPRMQPFFQVFGHNSHWGLKRFDDWGICIDQSQKGLLTAFHWPTKQVVTEPYLVSDRKEQNESAYIS